MERHYLERSTYPHCVMQLSAKEYNDLRDNTIHVDGIIMIDNKLQYRNVLHVGKHIKVKTKMHNFDENIMQCTMIHLSKIKNRVFCITTTVSEVLKMDSDTIIIPSSTRYAGNKHEIAKSKDDGIVLLFYAMLPDSTAQYEIEFDETFARNMKSVKNSTIKANNNHHGIQLQKCVIW